MGRKGLPLLPGFVKDQYVATYVLQLPKVSNRSLETPLFVFSTPKVMTPTVSVHVQMHPGGSSFSSQIDSRGWRPLGETRLLLQMRWTGQDRQWVGSLLPIYLGHRASIPI